MSMRPSSECCWSKLLTTGKILTKINEPGPVGIQFRTIAFKVHQHTPRSPARWLAPRNDGPATAQKTPGPETGGFSQGKRSVESKSLCIPTIEI